MYLYTACMSLTLSGSSVLQCFNNGKMSKCTMDWFLPGFAFAIFRLWVCMATFFLLPGHSELQCLGQKCKSFLLRLVWGSLRLSLVVFIMLTTKIYSVWTSAQIEVTCKGLQENLQLTGISGCNSTQYNQTGNEVEFHSFRHPVWRQPDCSTLETCIYYVLANAARVVLYNYWLEF